MASENMKRLLLCALLGLTVLSAQASGVYRWVDETGKVHYGDQPPPEAAGRAEQKNLVPSVIEANTPGTSAREAAENFPVILYTTDCGDPCSDAAAYLDARGIPYEVREATEPEVAARIQEMIGSLQAPVLDVGGKVLKGFSTATWGKALDAAGYPPARP